jgi:hypothetical protein
MAERSNAFRMCVNGALFIVWWAVGAAAADAFAQYLAGVELLRTATELSREEKADRYRSLSTLTGMTAQEAVKRLKQYRNNPEQWKKVYETMVSMLEETSETDKE